MEKAKKVTFKVTLPAGLKSTFSRKEIRSAVRAIKHEPAPRARAPREKSSSRTPEARLRMSRPARAIFINCPFDADYQPIFNAVLFTVCALGFEPRSALEVADCSDLRLRKILRSHSDFALRDPRSLTHGTRRKDEPSTLQHAFGVGYFPGAKEFGGKTAKKKRCLIFAKNQHVKSFISDINGLDIHGHDDLPQNVIAPIRQWLCTDARANAVPASVLTEHFQKFSTELPLIFARLGYRHNEPQYGDLLKVTAEWLEDHPVELPPSRIQKA